MKLYKDLSGNYQDCIVTYFNFEKYVGEHENKDIGLCIGYNTIWNEKILQEVKSHTKRIVFNGEHPCSFTQEQKYGLRSLDLESNFTDVYTICPYTAKWANELYCDGSEKFKKAMFAIDKNNIVHNDKIYDVIFYGSVCGQDHVDMVKVMSKFNYNFLTLGVNYWNPHSKTNYSEVSEITKKVTYTNIHTFQKWKILSQTKIVPISNQLYLHENHVDNIKKYDNWKQNEAWSNVDNLLAPQLKPRVVEAGLFKVLMLVKRDEWNAIEHWYTPDEDFLYYADAKDLETMIEEISNNWNKYTHIVNNAFKKAISIFTTKSMLDRMVSG